MSKEFRALSGWYSLNYPENWQFEIDSEGRYNFYQPNDYCGVLKISAYSAQDESLIIEEDLIHCMKPKKSVLSTDKDQRIYFTKESDSDDEFLHFWIAEKGKFKVFCTYTVDKYLVEARKESADKELNDVNHIMESMRFAV